eukprot:6880169-Alexandrium_andersonii.AAC.3
MTSQSGLQTFAISSALVASQSLHSALPDAPSSFSDSPSTHIGEGHESACKALRGLQEDLNKSSEVLRAPGWASSGFSEGQ